MCVCVCECVLFRVCASRVSQYNTQTYYGDKEVVALQNLSLDMYKGQVFCLLGHNGVCSYTIHTDTSMHTHAYTYTHACILTYTQMHVHTQTHTHIRTQAGKSTTINLLTGMYEATAGDVCKTQHTHTHTYAHTH